MHPLESLRQDLVYALRGFRRTPGFTAIVVLTLALGIGANAAIFSAVRTVLLRPLPFREPDRLMKLTLTTGDRDMVWSWPKFAALREGQRSFSDFAAYSGLPQTLRLEESAERIQTEFVNRGYLTTLGVTPVLGRNFLADEDQGQGSARVVMLSTALWRRRFNADPAVLGKPLRVGGDSYTVVGILPEGFRGVTGAAELWISAMSQDAETLGEAEAYNYSVIGRLRPGVSLATARAEVEGLGARIDRQYPRAVASEHWGATATALDGTRVDPFVRQSLLVLFGATVLVLGIACANVANLLLVRGEGRRREVAVRLAIGADRRHLVRQLLAESLLLAGAGMAGGLVVAALSTRFLATLDDAAAMQSTRSDVIGAVRFADIHLEPSVLAFALVVGLATGLLFGLWPALRASRVETSEALKSARHGAGGRGHLSARGLITVGEIALALVLLAGAGLMLKSLGKLLSLDQGFVADRVLTLRFNTTEDQVRDSLPAFYDRVLEEMRAVPGVVDAGLTDCAPLSGGCNGTLMALRDRPAGESGSQPDVGVHWVSPNWFGVTGIPLLGGRAFGPEDRVGTRKVVIINEAAARSFWPGQDPVGRPVSVGQGGFWPDTAWVIGVVGDVRYGQVQDRPAPEVYLSFYQSPRGRLMVFLKTRGDPAGVAGPARAVLGRLSPGSPVYDIRPFSAMVAEGLAYARVSASLLTMFAGLALGLATLGVYGVMAFAVEARRRELGIRSALGADRWNVVGLVVGQGIRLAAIGGSIGLAAAFAVTRVLRSQLYGVEPNDLATFAGIAAVLGGAIVVASLIPARRAVAVEPIEVLRSE